MNPFCRHTHLAAICAVAAIFAGARGLAAPIEQRDPGVSRELRETNEAQIQALSSRLQAKCDEQRMELRKDFLDSVFVPARREADALLSLLSLEEKIRLDRNLKLIYSQRPEVRDSAVAENREILRDLVSRRNAEKTTPDVEWVPGTPFSSARIVGTPVDWRTKPYRAEITFAASPSDSSYGYSVSVSSGPSRNSQEEIIEAALPIECRIFLTGLNKGALYVYPTQLPAFKSYADLGDPNKALSALLDPFREVARANEVRAYQAGTKPYFADTVTPAESPTGRPPHSQQAAPGQAGKLDGQSSRAY